MSHYEDEAQVEQLRRWWRENWMALAGGLVLGLAGIFGWEAWQNHKNAKLERASQMYEDLRRIPAERTDEARALGQLLIDEAPGTPYAAQAALLLAQRAADHVDWDGARARLEWVVEHTDDAGLRKIARLRLARVLWQLGKPDEALAQLETKDGDAFTALNEELRGDIQLQRGDKDAARAAYEKALAAGPAPASQQQLQRKLDDLGGGAAATQASAGTEQP